MAFDETHPRHDNILYDAAGNPVAVVLDNSIYRLETRSTITGQVGGAGAEKKVTTIIDPDDANQQRFQTEARIAPGSIINIGTSIPANPASLIVAFLEKPGGGENMLINGSVTPVVFSYSPPTGETVAMQELLIVFTADDFSFDGASFGPNAILTNGIKLEVSIDSVVTEIFNIKQNEDYIRIPGRIPLVNNTGPKDLLGVSFQFGGLIKLVEADGDYIAITIRDNLTSVKYKYLTGTIYATEEL